MDQLWFEMLDVRKQRLNDVVWIPLRAAQRDSTGKMGFAGYREEFFGVGSVGIPLDKKDAAAGLGWRDIGLGYTHRPSVEDGRYTPADVFIDFAHDEEFSGVPLVLSHIEVPF